MPRNKTKPLMPKGPEADGHNLDETIEPRKTMTDAPEETIEPGEPEEPAETGDTVQPAETEGEPEEKAEPAEEETEPETTEPADK